jgi:hypothetical protein
MLTKLFNSNSIGSLTILIVLALLLWSKTFINIASLYEVIPVSPLYKIVYYSLHEFKIISAFIAMALIIFEALFINHVLAENDLIPRNSYIAAYIFIIISSLFSDIIMLNPILIINVFIIAVLWLFLKLYERNEAYSIVFNIGTLLSIASMFYFPSFIFIILIWIGFIIYRLFSWREWLISILGLILPYIFLGSYYFWNDCFKTKIESYKNVFSLINFHDFHPTLNATIIISFLGLILLLSLFKFLTIINEKAIRIRKFLSLIIWFVIVSFISISISAKFGALCFVMILPSVSVMITLYLTNLKRQRWTEGIIITLTLLLIAGRFGLLSF